MVRPQPGGGPSEVSSKVQICSAVLSRTAIYKSTISLHVGLRPLQVSNPHGS